MEQNEKKRSEQKEALCAGLEASHVMCARRQYRRGWMDGCADAVVVW